MKKNGSKWWGTFELEVKKPLFWEIGALLLGIERQEHEWRIASNASADIDKTRIVIAEEESPGFSKKNLQFRRFVFQHTHSSITLTPVAADRPQVSHAETPFYLPPNEHVTIYVSSPAWVRVEVGQHKTVLDDIATLRQSDTWHGPSTLEGEICYASRTFCRTNLEEIPLRMNRVLSPVIIYNNAKEPLLIEQLSLPLPFLSIYADKNYNLFTEEIIIKNELHHKHTIKQGKGAPRIAPDAALISTPRLQLKASNFITLFYGLLTEQL
jgi:hypothetical protein